MPMRLFAVPLLFIFSSFSAQNSAPPAPAAAPYAVPPEFANLPNPVTSTPESIAKAKRMYGYDCAMCHGKEGAGDGDVGIEMKLKLTDLRDPATLKDTKDGELFYIIRKGKNQMPPEGDRAKDADVWNLVLYMRSMSRTKG